MTMTVNISGTFSEKQRPNNGLERVAAYMDANRIAQVPVVAVVEWHSKGETKTGEKIAVTVVAIEPGFEADGSDPTGLGAQLRDALDQLRKRQGLASVADTLFSAPRESYDFDGPDEEGAEGGPAEEETPGQMRLGEAGPYEVPEASAEEILAERAEAAAAEAGVPAATFSGGAE